ncbi:MAG: 2-oxo acid dehydrogenase subunit E2 [Pseudobdellovibrionaceae bacterium]
MGKIDFKKLEDVPVFRKIAFGTWTTAGDPSVYGLIELDMTQALKYMSELEANHGIKVSPAHLVGKAAAQVLKSRPEINGVIRLGRIYQRPDVDVFFQVNVPGNGDDKIKKASLSGTVIRKADTLSVVDIAKSLKEKANTIREGKDAEMNNAINTFKNIPWWLVRFLLNAVSFFNYDLNLNLTALGIPRDPFGSLMITNVGSLGIEIAWAPLVPYSKVPLLLTLGTITDKPVVVDGKIEIRPIMKVGITFDHRFMDGVHASVMSKHFVECFKDPWNLLK